MCLFAVWSENIIVLTDSNLSTGYKSEEGWVTVKSVFTSELTGKCECTWQEESCQIWLPSQCRGIRHFAPINVKR
jgi:hypothetical protein